MSSAFKIKRSTTPSWIPQFHKNIFYTVPPSYQVIISAVSRMKFSSSPCPLDKISIICLKRFPLKRSVLILLFISKTFQHFILHAKAEKLRKLCFSFHDQNNQMFRPIHWPQFAEGTEVVTGDEKVIMAVGGGRKAVTRRFTKNIHKVLP